MPQLKPGQGQGVCLTLTDSNCWSLARLDCPLLAGLCSGKTLLKVAEAEKRLGTAERDFIHTASINFLTPLRNFLEGDWKTISVRPRGEEKGVPRPFLLPEGGLLASTCCLPLFTPTEREAAPPEPASGLGCLQSATQEGQGRRS